MAFIGKVKTASQMTAIIALLLWEPVIPGISTPLLGTIALWVAAILTCARCPIFVRPARAITHTMSSYLSIEELSVSYGATRVLDRVSLDVERGEMIALLGSSGCGKTTLLRSIAGFVMPDEGAIRVDGRDITRAAAGKARAPR